MPGDKTPEECLETVIAAVSRNDVDTLAAVLALPPDCRQSVEAFLSRLPLSQREKYGPAERLVALLWTAEWTNDGDVTACRVVDVSNQNGTVSFGLDWILGSGRIRRSRMTLTRRSDGWRQIVPSTFVDGLLADNFRNPP